MIFRAVRHRSLYGINKILTVNEVVAHVYLFPPDIVSPTMGIRGRELYIYH